MYVCIYGVLSIEFLHKSGTRHLVYNRLAIIMGINVFVGTSPLAPTAVPSRAAREEKYNDLVGVCV